MKKLTKKEKYILEQEKFNSLKEETKELELELDLENYLKYDKIAKEKNISISDLIFLILVKKYFKAEKKLLKKDPKNNKYTIIDMYDLFKIKKLIKNKDKIYLIVTHDKPVVLIPLKDNQLNYQQKLLKKYKSKIISLLELGNLDNIEIASLNADLGYLNAILEFKILVSQEILNDLKEQYKLL